MPGYCQEEKHSHSVLYDLTISVSTADHWHCWDSFAAISQHLPELIKLWWTWQAKIVWGRGKKMMWRDHRYFNHPTVELFLNKQFKFQKKIQWEIGMFRWAGVNVNMHILTMGMLEVEKHLIFYKILWYMLFWGIKHLRYNLIGKKNLCICIWCKKMKNENVQYNLTE